MAIKHIVTHGIGPGSSGVNFIPTRGFVASTEVDLFVGTSITQRTGIVGESTSKRTGILGATISQRTGIVGTCTTKHDNAVN